MFMDFQKKVLNLTKRISKGKVTTYGQIARKLKTSPRAVGQALKRNPTPIVVPCHRVVMSNGEIGGYHGMEKVAEKIKLLRKEGIFVEKNKIKNFERVLYKLTTHTSKQL